MNAEWWALVCILLVIALAITARFLGPVLAKIFYGDVPGGRR